MNEDNIVPLFMRKFSAYTSLKTWVKKFIGKNIPEQVDANPLRLGNPNFVFIHINKNAGTSINRHLGIQQEQHYSVKEVLDIIGKKEWEKAFTFAVIRNPWDRVVSQYKYRVKEKKNAMADNPLSFEDWVTAVYGAQPNPLYREATKMFESQLFWLRNREEKIDIDYLIRFENLAEDFAVVAQRLGLSPELPHHNKTAAINYKDFYNESSRQIVAEAFKEDIAYFKYEF